MCLNSTTSKIGKIGILLSLVLTFFLVSDASAQCYCEDDYRPTVGRQTVKARRSVRTYRPARRVYQARRVYTPRRVYVPVRKVERDYGYDKRVYNVDRVYSNGNYENGYEDADYRDTRRIARDYGYRDGWEDGEDAGMERDAYHPENSGDYQKATNGYESDFGSKNLYRQAYRTAYLSAYRAGFRSIANRSTYRAATNW